MLPKWSLGGKGGALGENGERGAYGAQVRDPGSIFNHVDIMFDGLGYHFELVFYVSVQKMTLDYKTNQFNDRS